AGEYQRYPGHPATVALSTVLAPGVDLDVYARNASTTNIVQTKDAIYTLIPKIATGGSTSGTRPFVRDDFSSSNGELAVASSGNTVQARKERLLASVDEMLFADGTNDTAYNYNSSLGRVATSIQMPGQGSRYLFDHDTLERSRFFLTANSRSPEFNIHGLPRIAMWPVADEGQGPQRRSSFDTMIALCSTLRGRTAGAAVANSYIFRRAQPHHPTHDVTGSSSDYGGSTGLTRNNTLLNYLYAEMTTLQFPQTSSLGSSNNFGQKYGTDNAAQLAIQFFDYIRCTNLYDGVLARNNDGMSGLDSNGNRISGTPLYLQRENIANSRFTYTEQRITRRATGSLNDGTQTRIGSQLTTNNEFVFPGHGQVSPARWTSPGGRIVQGMGRMFTISEIGFQFICTADGMNDPVYAVNTGGVQSGGGSAPKALSSREADAVNTSQYPAPGNAPATWLQPQMPPRTPPWLGFNRWYSNFPPLSAPYGNGTLYGCNPTIAARHPALHPGYNPANWNMTLELNKPLATDEKRVQAMLMLEFFCPMSGWTKMFPEWAIVLDGAFMRSIQLNGQTLFPTTQDVIVKSNGNVYEAFDCYSMGGHVGPTAIAGGRAGPGWGTTLIGDDTNPYVPGGSRATDPSRYLANPGSGNNGHDGLNNWGLISQFITVKRNTPMVLTFGQRDLVIKIYDAHNKAGNSGQECQSISVSFDGASLPVPALVYSSNERRFNGQPLTDPANKNEINHFYYIDSFGRDTYRRSLQAPHWWCFNRMGCLNRMSGTPNLAYRGTANPPLYPTTPNFYTSFNSSDDQLCTGRLDTESQFASVVGGAIKLDNGGRVGVSLIPPESTNAAIRDTNGNPWSGSDVIRTFVPAVGDYRLPAARYNVPSTMWMRHPLWQAVDSQPPLTQPRSIHSFTTHVTTTEAGSMLPTAAMMAKYPGMIDRDMQLAAGVTYGDARIPDLPPDRDWAATANAYGDYDNGIGNARDGAYVNKPDEGNFFAGEFIRNNVRKFYRSGYFFEPWHNSDDWRTGVYMTPNRIVASPVMFGSLPTGVWSGGNVSTGAVSGGLSYSEGKPWQTLLFRPHASSNANYGKGVSPGHPGDNNPRDHYLLDLFFMPVVEPYAISEPLSIAGRINLNYQIVPFTNITRATGMHAVMKGEFMTAIPTGDTENAKVYYSNRPGAAANEGQSAWSNAGDVFWNEATHQKYWHRPIDVTKTLYQFDQKFLHSATGSNHALNRFRGLFRSPSQICEIHLIPDVSNGGSSGGEQGISSIANINANTSGTNLQSVMEQFWQNHPGTGDNTRERPYSNIYARVTTRSNTFRVHMRAQVITKARSTAPDTMDPTKDAVLGEYRGSALIERYIDPTDVANPLPDYGAAANPLGEKPLDTFYRFRTLESKRFSP
ncbi:Verru_Chthon cassette protein A, partial [Prosthecobacter sp.]|uniref:Verru_Chthon cassette protein A n=1 Tax=Prosthecobacter sp. TaxID=1965333 RepID=UPI0037835391